MENTENGASHRMRHVTGIPRTFFYFLSNKTQKAQVEQ